MARRFSPRGQYVQKESADPVGLPTSIAWSTIAILLLLGVLHTFGDFQPRVDATFGLISIILIPCGGLISLGLFKLSRKRARKSPDRTEGPRQEGILEGDLRAWWISMISPLENLLSRRRLNPNFITTLSFSFSLIGCLFLCLGWIFLAGWIILFAGTLDILDGRIARKTGRVSRRGAFFDSVLDRYGEVFIFLGFAAHFRGSILLAVTLLALVGSLMVSYTRARAEGVGVICKVGVMQRPERIVFLGFGAMFSSALSMLNGTLGANYGPPLMGCVLIFIAFFSNYTAVSRLAYVMRELKKEEAGPAGAGKAR